MKIRKLKLNNFRSFIGENTINFDNSGKNLFINGENGSGKSSICKSINSLFEASDKRKTKSIANSIFRTPFVNDTQSIDKYIEIQFNDGIVITFNENGYTAPENLEYASKIRRLKGFLEYKNLLPIYLYSHRDRHNLFRLFVEGPFARLKNPLTNKIIENEWNTSKKIDLPSDFYKGVFQLAENLKENINKFLKYFDPHLSLSFKAQKTWTTGELYLNININGKRLVNYGEYFNEAKLVALSISIYLAVILKQKDENQSDVSKLLIIDDIFIGMDLCNRIPLLKILEDLFSDYQIILTTFDENWYNLAQHYLTTDKWKFIKVYSKQIEPHLPQSFIFDSANDNHFEKAKLFYDKFEYPTCANYLRKAFEKRFKELLPFNLSHHIGEDGEVKANSKLNTNFENLISLLKECKLNTQDLVDFSLYTKILLNPLSHDNVKGPVYKREIESAFNVFDNLQLIKKEVIKDVADKTSNVLKLSVLGSDEIWYQYKYELVDNLIRISQNGSVGYVTSRIIPISSKVGNSEWSEIIDGERNSLEQEYKRVCELHSAEVGDYIKTFRNNKNKTIEEF